MTQDKENGTYGSVTVTSRVVALALGLTPIGVIKRAS